MKAIGIKLVDLEPMTAADAVKKGYRVDDKNKGKDGYEVTYADGYKSWSPKDVADKAYAKVDLDEYGNTITIDSAMNFVKTDDNGVSLGINRIFLDKDVFDNEFYTHSINKEIKYLDEMKKSYHINNAATIREKIKFIMTWAIKGVEAVNVNYENSKKA